MITEDEINKIQWIDAYIDGIEITKQMNDCEIIIKLENDRKCIICIHNCFFISISQNGYFSGKESVRDFNILKESEIIQSNKEKWIEPNINLQEFRINLNSGSLISCLITENSSIEFL